jgi:hypothetical protein
MMPWVIPSRASKEEGVEAIPKGSRAKSPKHQALVKPRDEDMVRSLGKPKRNQNDMVGVLLMARSLAA